MKNTAPAAHPSQHEAAAARDQECDDGHGAARRQIGGATAPDHLRTAASRGTASQAPSHSGGRTKRTPDLP